MIIDGTELGTSTTAHNKPAALVIVMAPAGQGQHVMQCPDNWAVRQYKFGQALIIEQPRNPVKIYQVYSWQSTCELHTHHCLVDIECLEARRDTLPVWPEEPLTVQMIPRLGKVPNAVCIQRRNGLILTIPLHDHHRRGDTTLQQCAM